MTCYSKYHGDCTSPFGSKQTSLETPICDCRTNSRLHPISRTAVMVWYYEQRGFGVKAGIAGFHKWFVEAFPDAVTDAKHPRQQETFDHVCIDMNQVRTFKVFGYLQQYDGVLTLLYSRDHLRCSPVILY